MLILCWYARTGAYMVEIANKHGKCSFTIDVIVIDKPSAPENLKVTDVTDRSVSLTWDEPHSDGGANVFGYVIEKKEGSFSIVLYFSCLLLMKSTMQLVYMYIVLYGTYMYAVVLVSNSAFINFSFSLPGRRNYSQIDDTSGLEYTISNLLEGTSYGFRVAAQNAVGVGEFTELPKPVTPKSQHGMKSL